MRTRLLVGVVAVLLAGAGCVTGTAHRLPLEGNPLRQEAAACEARCHALLHTPVATTTCASYVGGHCVQRQFSDRRAYAHCLDQCPGAMATDGAACPDPPESGVICEKTYRPNIGVILGATGVVLATMLIVGVWVAVAFSGPIDPVIF